MFIEGAKMEEEMNADNVASKYCSAASNPIARQDWVQFDENATTEPACPSAADSSPAAPPPLPPPLLAEKPARRSTLAGPVAFTASQPGDRAGAAPAPCNKMSAKPAHPYHQLHHHHRQENNIRAASDQESLVLDYLNNIRRYSLISCSSSSSSSSGGSGPSGQPAPIGGGRVVADFMAASAIRSKQESGNSTTSGTTANSRNNNINKQQNNDNTTTFNDDICEHSSRASEPERQRNKGAPEQTTINETPGPAKTTVPTTKESLDMGAEQGNKIKYDDANSESAAQTDSSPAADGPSRNESIVYFDNDDDDDDDDDDECQMSGVFAQTLDKRAIIVDEADRILLSRARSQSLTPQNSCLAGSAGAAAGATGGKLAAAAGHPALPATVPASAVAAPATANQFDFCGARRSSGFLLLNSRAKQELSGRFVSETVAQTILSPLASNTNANTNSNQNCGADFCRRYNQRAMSLFSSRPALVSRPVSAPQSAADNDGPAEGASSAARSDAGGAAGLVEGNGRHGRIRSTSSGDWEMGLGSTGGQQGRPKSALDALDGAREELVHQLSGLAAAGGPVAPLTTAAATTLTAGSQQLLSGLAKTNELLASGTRAEMALWSPRLPISPTKAPGLLPRHFARRRFASLAAQEPLLALQQQQHHVDNSGCAAISPGYKLSSAAHHQAAQAATSGGGGGGSGTAVGGTCGGALLVGAGDNTHKQTSILRIRSRRQSSPAHQHNFGEPLAADNGPTIQREQQQQLMRQLSENASITTATATATTTTTTIKSTPPGPQFRAGSQSSWQEPSSWTHERDKHWDNRSKTIELVGLGELDSGQGPSEKQSDSIVCGERALQTTATTTTPATTTQNKCTDCTDHNDTSRRPSTSTDPNKSHQQQTNKLASANNNNKLSDKNYLCDELGPKRSPKGTRRVSFGTISPILDTCSHDQSFCTISAGPCHYESSDETQVSTATTTTSTCESANQRQLNNSFSLHSPPLEAHSQYAEPETATTQQQQQQQAPLHNQHNQNNTFNSSNTTTACPNNYSPIDTTNQMQQHQTTDSLQLMQGPREAQQMQQLDLEESAHCLESSSIPTATSLESSPLDGNAITKSHSDITCDTRQQQTQQQTQPQTQQQTQPQTQQQPQQQDLHRQHRQQRSLSLARPYSPGLLAGMTDEPANVETAAPVAAQQFKPARAARPLPPRPPRASLQYQELAAHSISQSIRSSTNGTAGQQQPVDLQQADQQQQHMSSGLASKVPNANLLGRTGSVRRHSVALSISTTSNNNICNSATSTTSTNTTTTTTTSTSAPDNSDTMEEPAAAGDTPTRQDGKMSSIKKEKDKNWVESVMASAKTRQQEFAKLLEEHAQIVNEIKEAESSLNKRLSLCVSPTIQSKSNSREQISEQQHYTTTATATANNQSIKLAADDDQQSANNNSPHCRHPNDHTNSDDNNKDGLTIVSAIQSTTTTTTTANNDNDTISKLEQVP